MIETIIQAVQQVTTFYAFLAMTLGAVIGLVLGAIPGLNGTMAIALLIPMTLYVSPWIGIPMILAIYKSAGWGGSISAILIGIPGNSPAVVIALDGYPMTKQGKAGKALRATLYSGVAADTMSDLVTIFVCGPIATLALLISPPEYALLFVMALAIIASLGDADPIKTIISAALGLFVASIGYDLITQTQRLMFGILELGDGIKLIPMFIGMFALSECIYNFMNNNKDVSISQVTLSTEAIHSTEKDNETYSFKEFWSHKFIILRSTAIGTIIGALPGIGSTVSPWVGYSMAKKTSKHPEKFGRGSIEGLVGAQAAGNSVAGANLIPLLTLGIPGDSVAAMLIGTMTVHGMQPGPLIMTRNTVDVYSIFVTLLYCDIIYFLVSLLAIKYGTKISKVSTTILMPFIISMCVIGTYAINRSMFDVCVMFVLGIIGYVMKTYKYSMAAFMIAFILGPLMEISLRQTLILFRGNIFGILTRPVSAIFFLIIILFISIPIIARVTKIFK